ncbi:YchJ family protein [Shewanella donghaensis]|uniref:YchJ family protein n=1 Tax=Shewanella donghaensis TaxID=238836 RepID=UPI001184555C|nr:YchJ family protein [Shewanella donghaensis]
MTPDTSCPCGSDLHYTHCCQPYHLNLNFADKADTLMRSRYCAFVMKQFQYLVDTHHPQHLAGLTVEMLAMGADETQWIGLEVITHKQQSALSATVTFKAWFLNDGDLDAIFECSDFVFENGRWYYTKGEQFTADLPKRNDKCICHSGKKFKACCMKLMG